MQRTKYSHSFFNTLGALLIVFSIIGFLYTYGPILQVELTYHLNQLLHRQVYLEIHDQQFSLLIPKIGASGKIVPNIDPNNQREYLEALKKGIAHAKGTSFPGEGKTIYLFAHSTDTSFNILRYNAIFYLLKELKKGDEIEVYYQSQKYVYRVSDKKIVAPTETSYLQKGNENGEELILQTCYPPGTTWERLLIFAKRI